MCKLLEMLVLWTTRTFHLMRDDTWEHVNYVSWIIRKTRACNISRNDRDNNLHHLNHLHKNTFWPITCKLKARLRTYSREIWTTYSSGDKYFMKTPETFSDNVRFRYIFNCQRAVVVIIIICISSIMIIITIHCDNFYHDINYDIYLLS